jgi:flavin reductase (DIM6/NTAB) family NADH-FMN oxidoreductase RutF
MEVATSDLEPGSAYKLLTACVVPRPIAWITSMTEGGLVNLAPFSCYTIVCTDPPILSVTFGPRPSGRKDTVRNILRTREFVINIATDGLLRQVHASGEECGPDISEAAALGLKLNSSTDVSCPRIANSPVQMECRLERTIELGARKDLVVFGEVVRFHVRDDLYVNGKIDVHRLSPLARLGGPNYARLSELISMPAATLKQSEFTGGL